MRATSRPSRIPESQALPILQSVEDLLAITKEKADPAGILRLGMAQGIGDFALGEAVERLRMDFPKLDLRLRTDWSAGLCQQLADGSLDAALVLLPAGSRPPVELTGRFIGSLQTVVVQESRHCRFRRPIRLVHLAKEGWVLNPVGCGARGRYGGTGGDPSCGDLHVWHRSPAK